MPCVGTENCRGEGSGVIVSPYGAKGGGGGGSAPPLTTARPRRQRPTEVAGGKKL